MGAALTTGALGIITLAIPPRSVARLSFAAGMMLLALECVLSFLSSKAGTPATALTFQNYRLYVRALLPGVWLVFSLYYGRHQPPRLSTLWRVLVGLAFVIPLALILVPGQSLGSGDLVRYEAGGTLLLEGRGILVHGVVLLVNLLILVILHGVFQSVAGIMRWRMKFLLLGLAIIFLTTIYTCGWVLLEHTLSYSSNLIQSISLILGGGLVAWSLFRMGLSAVEVYPSRHFLLSTVATGLVVGYLFIVAAIAHGLSRPRSESAAQLAPLVSVPSSSLATISTVLSMIIGTFGRPSGNERLPSSTRRIIAGQVWNSCRRRWEPSP
jgi:hypothetical protein